MIVHVTPSIASRWEDPFIDSAASASIRDTGVDNVELAKVLLEPFYIVPVTIESLRDTLNKNLPRRIPVGTEVWESLKDDEAAQRTFCQLDKLTDGGRITSAVDSAFFKCVAEGKHRNMHSGMVRMGLMTVFDNLWDILLELLVSDTSVHYTRDTASWVAASASWVASSSDYSNLSLKTHNKEVVMFEEVSGKGSDASYQARKRLKTLLPKYFQSMNCMVLFSTKETNFRGMAAYAEHTGGSSSTGKKSGKQSGGRDSDTVSVRSWQTLIPYHSIQTARGFPIAITTSINFLRYARTWAAVLKDTPTQVKLWTDNIGCGPREMIRRC